MSSNAPTVVNVAAWVLPTSTTSGVSLALPSDVVSLSTKPSHCCSSITSLEPGFRFSNSAFSHCRIGSGVSGPFSHNRIVAGPDCCGTSSASFPPPPSPQAVMARLAAAKRAVRTRVLATADLQVEEMKGFLPVGGYHCKVRFQFCWSRLGNRAEQPSPGPVHRRQDRAAQHRLLDLGRHHPRMHRRDVPHAAGE